MKLHLPKLLFAAIVAFGACAQQAQAAAATKVQEVTIGEKTYKTTMVYGNNNVNISAADLALQEGTDYLGFSMYSDKAADASAGGSNHWANTNQKISSDIVIYDDNTTDRVEGLVIDNGYATTTTFTGDVYGNGTISKITAAPSSGETFVFTGDMSNYSGDIKMIGKNTNKLRIEGSSTGTGTIESAGTVTLKNTAIRTSKITASTLNIEGAKTTVNSALTLSATTLNLSKMLDVSAAGASVNFAKTSIVNIALIDLLSGNFGDVVKYQSKTNDVQGNGYFRVEGLKVASDTSKVSGNQIKVCVGSHEGFTVNANSAIDATYDKLAYGIAADATYDSAIMGKAKSLILDGTATLTLEASLPETVTEGIYIKGTGTKLNLANKDVVVNQGDFIILDGKKVALQGSGTYKIGTASIAAGVSVDKLWTGTVEYSYSDGNNKLTENLAKLGDAGFSTVTLTGAGGYFATDSGGLKDLHLELKDNGEIKALTVSNGNSRSGHGDSASYLASTITGDGTLDYTFKGDTSNGSAISAFKLEGNISGWDGLFQYNASGASDKNELDLFVTGKAAEVNVSIANKCAGKLNLIVDNADKTTSLNAAVTVNTLKATDNSSIEVGGVIITDSLTLGAGSTLIFNGGNLTLSEGLILSIAQIKLAEDIVFNTADTYTLISMATDARSATGAITFTDDVANWAGAVYNIGGVDYAASLQNTGTALSVHFQAIPEPTTATLSLLALAALAARRRRR